MTLCLTIGSFGAIFASEDAPPSDDDAPPPVEKTSAVSANKNVARTPVNQLATATTATASSSESSIAKMIASVESEIEKNTDQSAMPKFDHTMCRDELKDRLGKCLDEGCKSAAWSEFRVCLSTQLNTFVIDKRNKILIEAESLSTKASDKDSCLAIINLRQNCDTDEDCKERVWKTYQNCSDRFVGDANGAAVPKVLISADSQKLIESDIKIMGANDKKAQAELESQITQEKQAQGQSEGYSLEAEKKKLLDQKKELEERSHNITKVLQQAVPTPIIAIEPVLAPINTQNPFSQAPFNECQKQFVVKVKELQRVYQLNPVPRFDNSYVNGVKDAFVDLRKCYSLKNLGSVQVPTSSDILTSFGKPIQTTADCENVIVGDLGARCDKNWSCRQEAHLKSWACKAVVSEVIAAQQSH